MKGLNVLYAVKARKVTIFSSQSWPAPISLALAYLKFPMITNCGMSRWLNPEKTIYHVMPLFDVFQGVALRTVNQHCELNNKAKMGQEIVQLDI